MSNEPTTGIAIIYERESGEQYRGPLCKTFACALQTIVPIEGDRVLGYGVFDVDPGSANHFITRHQGLARGELTAGDLTDAAAKNYRDGRAAALPAGHAAVRVSTLQWWRELATLNPADLIPRIDAMIAAAQAA
ncbi:hypothetical protein [Lysobacter sp. ESA13C]|uniref:hypothetical protein n=1 Tax=Lysobacter sp. ESA13C TaxID=2862676 RepID=UPI001CBD6E9B|nr:hypothetical protein [Lysobacter sp. ESA13C]